MTRKQRVWIFVLVFLAFISIAAFSFEEDGAALFKAKCSICHGPKGEGGPAMKAPSLKETALTANQIVEHLSKGSEHRRFPHNQPFVGVTPEQIKTLSEFVKTLNQ
jgi:mono/diheme cytochrome c family protein